jgi:ubiquinone/menaquinone biosynthesis C-methylase UbiE
MLNIISDIVVCPLCNGKICFEDNAAHCQSCQTYYDRNGETYSFISKKMYTTDTEFENATRIISFWDEGWRKRLQEPDHKFLFEYDSDALEQYLKQDVSFHRDNRALMTNELDLDAIRGNTALNIGCGAGNESLILSYFGAKCVGMDITSQAANAAHYLIKKIKGSGFGIQGDARFIPLQSSSVDFVYSSGVLHHSPDITRSIDEIHRVLKPNGKAYIMLYAMWSLQFMQQRIIGILKGNIGKKGLRKYMSSTGEGAWISSSLKNPHTETFTKKECRRLFNNFNSVTVRKAGFNLNQVALLGKFVPLDKVTRFSKKYLDFLDPYLGSCLFIEAKK